EGFVSGKRRNFENPGIGRFWPEGDHGTSKTK
ncbi:unnamed protein product, partial [Cuscuta campestris]